MIISLCIPCMNRTYDLKKAMPALIGAANFSPPVEIMILDYNSKDDLAKYVTHIKKTARFEGGSMLSYKKYTKRDHYHMAHSRNLSVLASSGEYIVISSTDIVLPENYFQWIRDALVEDHYIWTRHKNRFGGVVGLWRNEFINAGGFDERFEFYGKEDRDLIARLERRGGKFKILPTEGMTVFTTPREEKYKNYRLKFSRSQLHRRAKKIYERNIEDGILVANEGEEWGRWD